MFGDNGCCDDEAVGGRKEEGGEGLVADEEVVGREFSCGTTTPHAPWAELAGRERWGKKH